MLKFCPTEFWVYHVTWRELKFMGCLIACFPENTLLLGQDHSHLGGKENRVECNLWRASLVAQKVKNLPASAGDLGSIPGWGRSPGGGHGNPLQCSCLENPMDRGAWRAAVHGVTNIPVPVTLQVRGLKTITCMGSGSWRPGQSPAATGCSSVSLLWERRSLASGLPSWLDPWECLSELSGKQRKTDGDRQTDRGKEGVNISLPVPFVFLATWKELLAISGHSQWDWP